MNKECDNQIRHIIYHGKRSVVTVKEQSDIYKEVRIMKHPLGIARVYVPDLPCDERERRMNQIKKAAVDVIMKGKITDDKSQEVKKSS